MAVDVLGLVVLAVFYVTILIIGIVAGRKSTKSNDPDELFIANRSFGLFVASFTTAGKYCNIIRQTVLAIPFSIMNPAVDMSHIQDTWTGHMEPELIGLYIDTALMLIMGGMPWQALYQRVLACKSPKIARNACLMATCISLLLALPPTVVGAIGSATDWNATEYPGNVPLEYKQWAHIFPMVLQFLCPTAVSIIGIGAVSAAVMSSADSCVLSTGSVFANNVYKNIFRPKASQREIVWVLRLTIVVVGTVGAVIALTVGSVYGLFIMSADLMYVIQFPQLVCVLWVKCANTYGSLTGFVIGLFLRVAGGEPFLKIAPLIQYPMYHEEYGQLFPFKTESMLCSLFTICVVSYITERLFTQGTLSMKFNIFHCYKDADEEKKKDDDGDIEKKEPFIAPVEPDHFELHQENRSNCRKHRRPAARTRKPLAVADDRRRSDALTTWPMRTPCAPLQNSHN
ncbi:high-affinity choline transporter 1-like [Mizuhopecten yessoensis]|uniref:high-affinity choline transporter 1-like n=1 Tax=Mizuhopecten yessoensis TaxID=6573 RepID=UPI000B45F588|nr:high-affinity choline transporter 1-like [Mizuhopecten yessoensis]